MIQKVKGIAEINIDQLREQLRQRKDFRENQNSESCDFVTLLPETIIVPPTQAPLLGNQKNILALQQYMQLLAIKAYSPKTIRTYKNEFLQYLKKLDHIAASSLNAVHVKRYMEYCAITEQLSENTLHSRLNAIKFYYENVLDQDKMLWEIPRAKRPLLLPKVLSENELKRMFLAVKNLKHKAILFTAYSAGLRVSEVVKLRLQDIDSNRMQIFVARAKGKKRPHS
ncbi:MAG: phage integrase N-terminal SAM-like domain-containing protein [Ferruginibacter sp.]